VWFIPRLIGLSDYRVSIPDVKESRNIDSIPMNQSQKSRGWSKLHSKSPDEGLG
jgi:hypothetical protein